jgi:hypothetical protein
MRCPLCIIGGKNTNTAMTATVREPYPKNLHQMPPSTRSPITETTARTRDYTASLLSNERVRGVVDGGHGLLHLRPRVSIYGAVTRNPRRYRHRHKRRLAFTGEYM